MFEAFKHHSITPVTHFERSIQPVISLVTELLPFSLEVLHLLQNSRIADKSDLPGNHAHGRIGLGFDR